MRIDEFLSIKAVSAEQAPQCWDMLALARERASDLRNGRCEPVEGLTADEMLDWLDKLSLHARKLAREAGKLAG